MSSFYIVEIRESYVVKEDIHFDAGYFLCNENLFKKISINELSYSSSTY